MHFIVLLFCIILGAVSKNVIGKKATYIFVGSVFLIFFLGLFGAIQWPMFASGKQVGEDDISRFIGIVLLFGVIILGAISFSIIKSKTGNGGKAFIGSIIVIIYVNAAWMCLAATSCMNATAERNRSTYHSR